MNTEWVAIVNPSSGGGVATAKWDTIQQQLKNSGFEVQYRFTEKNPSTIQLTKELIESGFDHLIVMGGDGTMNEVVNGIMQQQRVPSEEVILGIIPLGTGNDWIKTIGIPNDVEAAINIIREGKILRHDVGWATYQNEGTEEKRYFINTAGTGLDSIVVEKTNEQKLRSKSSAIAYMLNLLKSFIRYRPIPIEITADNDLHLSGKMLDFAVGIGRYNGGGMLPFPNAHPCDGLFEALFAHDISKLKMLTCFPKLFNGRLNEEKKVHYFQAKSISVTSQQPIFLETDGETLGFAPFTFGICPKALSLFSPKEF